MTDLNRDAVAVVDNQTIVCDFRKRNRMGATSVRRIANRHFWGSDSGLVKDAGGTLLGNNLVNVYHVQSIQRGLWVASLCDLKPSDTRLIVSKLLTQ